MSVRERTAGVVVIGNEILSGKVVDTNSPFLAQELRKLGVALRRIVTIPDELDLIASTVREFHERFDHVFTSGGVGPDARRRHHRGHRARARPPRDPPPRDGEQHPRASCPGELNAAHLKMAEVPEGAELLQDENLNFPTIRVENIYILPGIPEILRKKFAGLRALFADTPYHLKVIYTSFSESMIAESLNQTVVEFPELLLGSYPKIGDPEYMVKLTMESKDGQYVQRAFDRLLFLLPAGSVVRTE